MYIDLYLGEERIFRNTMFVFWFVLLCFVNICVTRKLETVTQSGAYNTQLNT